MTRSFSITVPDVVATALEDWAHATGRTRGHLIGFLLESMARLKYPHRFTTPALPDDVDPADHDALLSFVTKLAEGNLNAADVAMIAHIVKIDVDELQRRVDKSKNGNGSSANATAKK